MEGAEREGSDKRRHGNTKKRVRNSEFFIGSAGGKSREYEQRGEGGSPLRMDLRKKSLFNPDGRDNSGRREFSHSRDHHLGCPRREMSEGSGPETDTSLN